MAFSGSKDPVFIHSKKYAAGDSPVTIKVPQNASTHQVAINAVDGTSGTASVTLTPVGMIDAQPLLEADGSTPVVLTMVGGDARSAIVGSLQDITFTLTGFDGTEFKLSVASYFD